MRFWLLALFLLSACDLVVPDTQYFPPPMSDLSTLSDRDMQIYILDVGQGDASIILGTLPENVMGHNEKWYAIVIDCGPKSAAPKIINHLRSHNVTEIHLMIGTNPDRDHIGGCAEIMRNIPVYNYLTNVFQKDTDTYNQLLQEVQNRGNLAPISNDEGFAQQWAGFFGFFNFTHFVANDTNPSLNGNDASIVTWVQRGKFSMLFPGDCERDCERELVKGTSPDIMKDYNDALSETNLTFPTSTVLKAGHHGSVTSSSKEFLNHVQPSVMVFSSAKGCPITGCTSARSENQYGHPRSEVIFEAMRRGINIYRTDLNGDITIIIDKEGNYTITTSR